MPEIRKLKDGVELRAYLNVGGTWRHVYIISGYDQIQLLGEPMKMLEYKLTKASKQTFAAEKILFHQKKPKTYKPNTGGLA